MSSSVSVAAEWDLLSDRFYRRITIYSPLPWSSPPTTATASSSGAGSGGGAGRLDLSTHIVAAAPFGGPIAAVRDDSKIVQLHSEPSRRRLLLFSSSGHPLASSPWTPHLPRLHSLAFSSSLNLLALLSDGSLLRFRLPDLKPVPTSTPAPLLPPASGGVADAVFWGGGVAILTEDNRLVVTTDIEVDDPHPRELADPGVGEDEQVLCMAVVEPQFVMSGSPEVLLAVGDRVVAVDEDGVQVLGEALEIGPVQKMAVSPNGKLLAAFAHDGRLLVIPTDFSRIIFEYECDSALPPDQIAWCGLDSVLLYWPEVLLMVGPNGDPVQYNYDEPIMLIPECDGVRILSNSSMEFLHRVPDCTTSIFGIGSMSPAALLYDARDHYDKQSAKLRLCKGISYAAVAAHADNSGRRKLAAMLVDHESQSSKQDAAFLLLKELRELERNPMASKGSPLHAQQVKLVDQAQRLFGETKEHLFESKSSEEHLKLLRVQHHLEVSTKQAIFVGSSVSDTIKTCIAMGNDRAAVKVKSEFKVPDKRWYWLKTCALATVGNWEALETFSKDKKPPGGYKPFVEACIDAGQKNEALKYIAKLTDPAEKSAAYSRLGMDKEAEEAALQAANNGDELFSRLKFTLGQNALIDTLRDRLSFQTSY